MLPRTSGVIKPNLNPKPKPVKGISDMATSTATTTQNLKKTVADKMVPQKPTETVTESIKRKLFEANNKRNIFPK